MKGLLHLFLVLILLARAGLSTASDPILTWIEKGDLERIETYLVDHDINERYGESGTTMLVHAIVHGHSATVAWLIEKGADVNLPVTGTSPLMYAAGRDDFKKVSHLIEGGANIEALDPQGNTSLFYAAGNGNLRITKYLVKKGASLSHKNNLWQTAYDMAVRQNRTEVAKYLRFQYEKRLPDLLDGPYVKWGGKRSIRAFYLVHDSKSQITRKSKVRFKPDANPYIMKGFAGDTLKYRVYSRKDVPPDHIVQAGKIMVVGDIHGGYDSLVYFLWQNGVINEALQWIWDKGHLVFVGDIFDRGEKVTETLWLIYQLEEQAYLAGGAVHYILGNHEIMVLSGSTDYVSNKYLIMTSRLNINYSSLFNKRTVLGQWLRTRNTILRINDNLFVHAGLSPNILKTGLNITEINDQVRYFLNHPDREYNDRITRNELLGSQGPFWYRGYLEDNHEYRHLSEQEFDRVVKYFDVRSIFIGHTNVKKVTSIYNNRVFAIDVPFYTYGYSIQGLLIEGDAVYLLNSKAEIRQIR